MASKQSRTRNSILNLSTSLGVQLLATLLKFAVRTVFIHSLGKAYLGVNSLFSDILTMLSLTELGFDTAINFKLYKPLAEKDDHRVRVLIKFYKEAYRVIGTVILILGLCVIPLLPVLIRDYDTLTALKINAPLIFFLHIARTVSSYWFFAYRSAVMKANQKKYVLDMVEIGITIATNIAKILVLVFLKDFVVYTATVIVFNVIRNLINAFVSKRYCPSFFEKEKDRLSKEEVKGLFKDCMALFAFKVNGVVLKATDNLVISSFIGISAVGLYSNYLLLFTTCCFLLVRFYQAVKASMGNLFATASMEKKYFFFQVMNYLTIILYGTAGAGLAVSANELIHVWVGSDYVVAQPLAILIGIEVLFDGLKCNLGQIRHISGIFRQMWYRPIIGVIVNLVVSVVLVQFWGLYGVILGTIISTILANFCVDPQIIHKYCFKNYKPVSEYYKKNLLYLSVLIAITALDMWICNFVFVGHGWFSLIVHALIVAITVPSVFLALYWKSDECQYLMQLIRRIFKKRAKTASE